MRLKLPPITVVIPAHNAERFIAETLASIAAQSLQPSELIVVNDGSTDRTGKIAADAGARVVESPGLGAANALNLGIDAAHTELIAHFDADDLMLPDKLARQASCFLDDPKRELGLVSSDLAMFDGNGLDQRSMVENRRRSLAKEPACEAVLGKIEPKTSADNSNADSHRWTPRESAEIICATHAIDVKGVYRKSAWAEIGGFNSSFRCAYDMDFVWRLSRHFDVMLVNEVLFHGRRHHRNLSGNSNLVATECTQLFDTMSRHADAQPHLRQLKDRKRTELLDLAYQYRTTGRWFRSANFYWRAAWA